MVKNQAERHRLTATMLPATELDFPANYTYNTSKSANVDRNSVVR